MNRLFITGHGPKPTNRMDQRMIIGLIKSCILLRNRRNPYIPSLRVETSVGVGSVDVLVNVWSL